MTALEDNPRADHGRKERIIQALCKLNGVAYVAPGQPIKLASMPSKRELWTQSYRDVRFRRKYNKSAYHSFAVAIREQDTVRQLARDRSSARELFPIPAHTGRYPHREMFFRAWAALDERKVQ